MASLAITARFPVQLINYSGNKLDAAARGDKMVRVRVCTITVLSLHSVYENKGGMQVLKVFIFA